MSSATSVASNEIVVTNPANGKELGRVSRADAPAVDRAVRKAAEAFSSWSQIPVVERTRRFFKLQVLLDEHLDELATLVANENGKMFADARGEVRRGIECVEFACGMPSLLMGDSLEGIARGIDSNTIRQPLGVCVGVTPFNFPTMIPAWMFPIAIAAGNTFIIKPSPQTPLSAERLLHFFNQCGFPEDVLQVVHGDADVVEALIKHELTAAVSFVGSSAIARRVQSLAVEHHKRVTALGGAKNFLIVMPDGVNDATLDGILGSAFGAAGERCLAGSVVIAVGEAGDKLVPMLQNATSKMKVAAWETDGAQMGPVISEQARTRIVGYIENGLRTSDLVADGRKNVPSEGSFVGPTIFDRVDPTSPLARDEIFGPVLSIVRVPTLEAAIELANRSAYGNASSIFTQSGAAAQTFAHSIAAGMVGINVGVAAPMAFFPFGGIKESIFGDMRMHGKDGVAFYTQQKVVITRW
ncbi:MAG TPA: CoA-acylating methylmalonate-semialdehyde dehydrogenase [Candidatus Baltobacteraceae bacterium]|jgi:malonate-semialdehyde dehydrogenase (acetylating)/methylmalonate-semialdehyde dehydrogenase